MKKLKLSLFLLGILVFMMSCEAGFESDQFLDLNQNKIQELNTRAKSSDLNRVFMPLNSIPEELKDKTSPEEYELWKMMSSRYEINYSFLDMNLREDQRENLKNTLKIICKKIEDGSLGQGNLGYFVVQKLKKRNINSIEKLSRSESGEVAQESFPEIIYEARNVSFAYVRVKASFYTNSEGTEITRVSGVRAYKDGTNAVSFEGSCSSGGFGSVILNVKCSGTLTYRINNSGGTASESFSKSLNMKVIPD